MIIEEKSLRERITADSRSITPLQLKWVLSQKENPLAEVEEFKYWDHEKGSWYIKYVVCLFDKVKVDTALSNERFARNAMCKV